MTFEPIIIVPLLNAGKHRVSTLEMTNCLGPGICTENSENLLVNTIRLIGHSQTLESSRYQS